MIVGTASFEQTEHYQGSSITVEHDDPGTADAVVLAALRAAERAHCPELLAEALADATMALELAGYVQLTPWAFADGWVTARVARFVAAAA